MPLLSQTKTPTDLEQVSAVLGRFFAVRSRDAQAVGSAYAALWSNLQRLSSAGGKRLRPRMVYLSYRAFDGRDDPAVAQVAAACELLHLSMLVHDDIIDRDLVRYGTDNISGAYLEQYRSLIPDADARRHYADSAALLGGDVLLSGAYELILAAELPGPMLVRIHKIFSRSIFEVVGGELIDTEASFRGRAGAQALNIARYKTAGYSFITPLLLGAVLAGADDAQQEAVRQFAEQLGIAFQIQDDILGSFGDEVIMGKSASGDIREGKRTYLAESFESMATPAQLAAFHKLYGNPDIDDAGSDTVRKLLMDSGARSQAELQIASLEAGAITALAALKLPAARHDDFISLINQSLKRTR